MEKNFETMTSEDVSHDPDQGELVQVPLLQWFSVNNKCNQTLAMPVNKNISTVQFSKFQSGVPSTPVTPNTPNPNFSPNGEQMNIVATKSFPNGASSGYLYVTATS